MRTSEIIKYYSNKKLREKIVELSKSREVASRFKGGGYGKRPQTIMYENEIMSFVKQGATSFHASEERWRNPNLLKPDMNARQLDELRIGWDLIIDIDTKVFEYAKISADLIMKALKYHNLRNFSVKFSGGTGFHIGINWESFPEEINGIASCRLFPDTPTVIANYIQSLIKDSLAKEIISFDENIERVAARTGKSLLEITEKKEEGTTLNPFSFIEIDTVALSSRHLIRMPYVFNEKSWRISQPCDSPLKFDLEMAEPVNLDLEKGFLDKYKKKEARQLVLEAYDWWSMRKSEEEEEQELSRKEFKLPEEAIPVSYFPPCIKNITNGLKDGRKRAVFILINFLRSAGWDLDSIERFTLEVNQKNDPPLRENYIRAQIQHQKKVKKPFPPPNCDNKGYMLDIGICIPDRFCSKIKNPTTYTLKKFGFRKK